MKRKNIKQLTKLEAERQANILEGELDEELEATGQESNTKAVKWVQEKGKERRHEEKEQLAEAEWKADDVKGKVFSYRDVILGEMKRQMRDAYDSLPQDFLWYPVKDKTQGLQLWIRDPKNKWYARGMTISMVPHMDIQCVQRLIEKALNHMDDLEQAYTQGLKSTEKIFLS